MQRRIAIVNRGEPARRLIHAARELNHERGWALESIALHTEAERRANFVREAHEGVLISAPEGENPYLDHDELRRALRAARADAAWVGWGFVAEDPRFVELCDELGVTFIGPTAEVMRQLGDKVSAKLLAEKVGVPVAPWSQGAVESPEDAREHAERIGFPLMIKAAAGGGGRGIRIVESKDQLESALERAQDEGRKAFGDPRVLLERLVRNARHVEVQVIADHHGGGWALGVRDCSVQRRSQKLVEESSSPVLTPEQDQELRRSALDLVLAAGYRNAGTVEFLYQPEEELFAFLEVNTRLQVEHPVTELVTGTDLVKLQLDVAAGGRLAEQGPDERGHAIEVRLNAEDSARGFAPAPGTVELFSLPTGPGIRVDTGIAEGDSIPPEYDSMIAKVIAWGSTREEARARLQRALEEMAVAVRGGATNRSFLIDLLASPEVQEGTATTRWLDEPGIVEKVSSTHGADIALIAAAVESAETAETLERDQFYAAARRGRPKASHEVERTLELRLRGESYKLAVARIGPSRFRVKTDEGPLDVGVERLGTFTSRLSVNGRVHRVVSIFQAPDHLVEVDGAAHRVSLDEGGLVRAPAPALVVSIAVAAGDEVTAGQPVVVLEAMKMESTVSAPFDGTVAEIMAAGNTQVDSGAPLVRIEAEEEERDAPAGGARVEFDPTEASGEEPPARVASGILDDIRALLLGFDVTAAEARDLVERLGRVRSKLPPEDPDLLAGELGALRVFTDLAELARVRPPSEGELADELVHSPREHFHHYLRSLDAEREGVPEAMRAALERAVGHYGVHDMERSEELADASYRIFLAQERMSSQVPAVAGLLDGRLRDAGSLPAPLRKELRETLDRLIAATQIRLPEVSELARSVRFAAFDGPLITAARERVHRNVRERLDGLSDPDAPGYDEAVEEIVASPHPLLGLLRERLEGGVQPHEPMLEILTRRYYKIRDLEDVQRASRDSVQIVTAIYRRDGRRVRLASSIAEREDVPRALAAISELLAESEEDTAVVDLYLAVDPATDSDALSAELVSALDAAPLPAFVHRIAVSVAGAHEPLGEHFTFRPSEGGFAEEEVFRGLHPMIARRLRIRRLDNFALSRASSPDDTYLFHCTAHDSPRDERLVALAEVRDLTPLRDPDGALTALPELEHKLAGCLQGIRQEQSARPRRRRLSSNHVFLYVWSAVDLPVRELTSVARRLAPMTEGLGLEEVLLSFTTADGDGGPGQETALRFSHQPGAGITVAQVEVPAEPLAPLDDYAQRVQAARRRGSIYPYELTKILAGPEGGFTEYDLDEERGELVPVERQRGENTAGIITGIIRTPTEKHPEGVARVVLFGDPTRSLGSVAEAECMRVNAAIDLAEAEGLPVEWFALSSGARIARDTGTENMDWVARVLRRIILFTQAGGEVNVVVAGINVGAQPYWNAEATMLMHTKGILVMTPDSAMVLTGKQALDYSGGVSAEDNFGIGGFDRIMGPNGQAQYWAPHLAAACELLMAHYAHTYVAPGERHPRRRDTDDAHDRDVRLYAHPADDGDFTSVGDIFSSEKNPERKKAFDVRTLMRSVIDQDRPPLERWAGMADADTAVVFDAHLGGFPVSVLGIESKPIVRRRFLPADGPDAWSAGTLFPLSSKKAARAINAASGNRPLVVLANLSGFDGSPESLRKHQLEYGAEIGRAVVNFEGPIVFCVVSRYHGGAFVVFSGALNEQMQVMAVEGSYASVIGGAPAAAVVFARDVQTRTDEDPRVTELEERLENAEGAEQARLRAELSDVRAEVRSEKLGEVADEFDNIHSVQRAQDVGSVDDIISARNLRPRIIEAIERGLERSDGG